MSWLQGLPASAVLLLEFPSSTRNADAERGSIAASEHDVRVGAGGVARACALPKERQVLIGYGVMWLFTVVWCVRDIFKMIMGGSGMRCAALQGVTRMCLLGLWAFSIWLLLTSIV